MHKKILNFTYDTTVIFLYVHILSTEKNDKNCDKLSYTPSYPQYPQVGTGFLVEIESIKYKQLFCEKGMKIAFDSEICRKTIDKMTRLNSVEK